jgi:hypothetical protein
MSNTETVSMMTMTESSSSIMPLMEEEEKEEEKENEEHPSLIFHFTDQMKAMICCFDELDSQYHYSSSSSSENEETSQHLTEEMLYLPFEQSMKKLESQKKVKKEKRYYTLTKAVKMLKKENQCFLETYGFTVDKIPSNLESGPLYTYLVYLHEKEIHRCSNVVEAWTHATNTYRDLEQPSKKDIQPGDKTYWTLTSAIRLPKKPEQRFLESKGYVVKKHRIPSSSSSSRNKEEEETFVYRVYKGDEWIEPEQPSVYQAWKLAEEYEESNTS